VKQVSKKKKKKAPEERIKRNGPVPFEVRVRIIQAVMRGTRYSDVAVGFGVSMAVVQKFVAMFESGGIDALRLTAGIGAGSDRANSGSRMPPAIREEVVATRQAHPSWGTRRIVDVLERFAGLGVSETTVRRILHEAGLITERDEPQPRDKPERRFERAEPNQLWQSDIFQFELRRHQVVYLVGFMDDYSRYLVSWAMAHHHKASLVIDALERGIAEYGEPREVLTDQGRQYVAWRGETEFQQLLQRRGIRHSKSRPQHPETLGKIERFWKTLWDEFLRKTVFADFADCLRRVTLFVQHYNFQRPHQGLDGLVPADRFFRAAPHVRAAVEATVAANALRLAQEKPPQKPFYLVGRLGDQDLSIAAAGGALRVQVGDASQTIPMTKEHDDATNATHHDHAASSPRTEPPADRGALRAAPPAPATQLRQAVATQAEVIDDARETNDEWIDADEIGPSSRTAPAWRAALADRPQGSGSGGATPSDPDPVGALGPPAGDDGDHRARHLAPALLPARDESARRDDAGADPGRERGVEPRRRDADAADRRARGEGGAARTGEPAARPAAASDEEGAAEGSGGVSAEAWAEARPALDERWARTFSFLEEADDAGGDVGFDPDDGWRDRAVSWHRKLAGADAPIDGDADGQTTSSERTFDVQDRARHPDGAAEALRGDPCGPRGAHDDQRRSDGAGDRAGQHAVAGPSSGSGDRDGDRAAPDGAGAETGRGENARDARGTAREGEREAQEAAASGRRHDDGGGRDHPQPARAPAGYLEELVAALETLAETAEQRRRSRTTDAGLDAAPRTGAAEDDVS
jgi:transposase InsO family protein